jgi:hypothetical protein
MHISELARQASRANAYRGIAQIQQNRLNRREGWKAEAKKLWDKWRTDPLFLLGIGMYWGEGAKSPRAAQLRISNSDVNLLRAWLAWCQRFLPGVPLYNGINLHPIRVARGSLEWYTKMMV